MLLPAVLARGQAITHDGLISEIRSAKVRSALSPGQHSSAGRFFLGNEQIQSVNWGSGSVWIFVPASSRTAAQFSRGRDLPRHNF